MVEHCCFFLTNYSKVTVSFRAGQIFIIYPKIKKGGMSSLYTFLSVLVFKLSKKSRIWNFFNVNKPENQDEDAL